MLIKRLFIAAILCFSAHANLAFAIGVDPTISIYYFNGNCEDCAEAAGSATYGVVATLLLENYTEGEAIEYSNFVSLHYSGSNIVYEITVDPGDVPSGGISGAIGADFPGNYSFSIDFIDGLRFETSDTGDWFICAPGVNGFYSGECSFSVNSDVGLGDWDTAPGPTGPAGVVPVPAAAWLLGSALLGLAGAARRKRT